MSAIVDELCVCGHARKHHKTFPILRPCRMCECDKFIGPRGSVDDELRVRVPVTESGEQGPRVELLLYELTGAIQNAEEGDGFVSISAIALKQWRAALRAARVTESEVEPVGEGASFVQSFRCQLCGAGGIGVGPKCGRPDCPFPVVPSSTEAPE